MACTEYKYALYNVSGIEVIVRFSLKNPKETEKGDATNFRHSFSPCSLPVLKEAFTRSYFES